MADKVDGLIGVVILMVLVGALVPSALVTLFNATLFTGVPVWVSTTLGAVGAIGVVMLLYRAGRGGK